jgi:Xaa-Pro aminopeptidase
MTTVRLKKFLSTRLQRCREIMLMNNLDGLIVADPADVRYLTGFSGEDSVLLITAVNRVIVTDSRYVEQLRQECPGLRRFVRHGAMPDAVAEVWRRLMKIYSGRKKLLCGIEADSATYRQYRSYRKLIGKNFKTVNPVVSSLRILKDGWEIDKIRGAIRIAQSAVQEALPLFRNSLPEREIASIVDYVAARHGSESPAFSTIVAFGPHAAQPHARPGLTRLRKNQPILIDWGATFAGYRSDLTRCYVLGRIPPVFAEVYRWVLEAQDAAIKAVMTGVPLTAVDQAARNVLKKVSLPVYGHGTGHGLGLAVHEGPALGPKSKGLLEEGMVLTIEPGVYIPGQFGIRIEDDVLVTARGAKVLSTLAKCLESVSIG